MSLHSKVHFKLHWLGKQARRGLSFLSGALPGARSTGSCLRAFSRRKPLAASRMAAAAQRIAIEAEPQRYIAADEAHRAHHVLDDVGAGCRRASCRSSFGSPSRVTARLSSMPSQDRAGDPTSLVRDAGRSCGSPFLPCAHGISEPIGSRRATAPAFSTSAGTSASFKQQVKRRRA
jgi:hypothetical protein